MHSEIKKCISYTLAKCKYSFHQKMNLVKISNFIIYSEQVCMYKVVIVKAKSHLKSKFNYFPEMVKKNIQIGY